MREEIRRRRRNSKKFKLLIFGSLLALILLFAGLIFYVSNLDQILEEDYAKAEVLVEQGDYEAAEKIFRTIYERHPNFHLSPQALYQAGEVLNLYMKSYHEALLAYLLVEKDFPNSELARKAQMQVAEIYKYRLRDFSRAIVAYQKLVDAGIPNGDRLLYEIADAYFRLENFEQARIEFETLGKTYTTSELLPEVGYRIAVSWSLEGNLQEAEKAFRRVSQQWPDTPYALEARFGLAGVLEEEEQLREALQVLQELAGHYPNAEALAKKTEQVEERIRKKKKAI